MKGLISYFDILGYQNFLEKNKALETAEQVLAFINETPEAAVTELGKNLDKPAKKRTEECIQKYLKTLIFSDTILMAMEIPEGVDESMRWRLWMISIALTAVLFRKLFEYGLPSRAVIEKGEYLFQNNCVAGGGIVDAYKLTNQLEFSGICIAPSAMQYMKSLKSDVPKVFVDFLKYSPSYLIPLKGGDEKQLGVVDWLPGGIDSINASQMVRDAFWAFDKDIPFTVEGKVENTVKLIEYFRFNRRKVWASSVEQKADAIKS